MTCVWRPASEQQWSKKRALPAPAPWWFIRREIEHAMGMYKQRQVKANLQHHYLKGRLEGCTGDLASNDVVAPGDHILVRRVPVSAELYKRHCRRVPPSSKQWWRLSEEERLRDVLSMTFNDMVYVGDADAAQAMQQNAPTPDFDESVTCPCCGHVGHERWHCKRKFEPGFVPLAKRQLPHGIPRNKLRVAVTDADMDVAYQTVDGTLVVVK